MDMESMISGVEHVGVPTRDLAGTIEFYQSLGFAVVYEMHNKVTGKRGAFLKLKNLMIETYESDNVAAKPGALDHVALSVRDVDRVFEELKAGNYEMVDKEVQSRDFWEHGVRFFTIFGPNREKIEFSQIL